MKKIAALLGGIVALGAASAAQAAIIVTTLPTGTPPTQSGVGTLTGYTGWTITLATDDGANITAVDFSGTRGFSGNLHQAWTFDAALEDFTPTPSSIAATRKTNSDSHFLLPGNSAANAVIGSALIEDSDRATSPLADTASFDFGTGSFLKGAFGIAGPAQSSTLELAYLVLPNGQTPQFLGQVATSSGTFTVQSAVVPEPASIGAIGLFAVGLLARRRRG